MKRWFLVFLFCLVTQGASKQPNILFICVDDLKPVLGCYGDKVIKSPNIDRLAARGIVFEHAYCNQAVCAPSRNSLLSGVRPSRMGIYDLRTNFRAAMPDAVTLPQFFKEHGYRSEGLGKIFHVGHGNHEDPASWSVPHWGQKSIFYALPESGATNGLTREEALFANQTAGAGKLPRGAPYEAADVPDDGYPDGKIANETILRLRAAAEKPQQPFFLAVGFLKPHLPFCAPKKYWDMYDRASFKVPDLKTPPEGAPKFAPSNWGELRNYSDMPDVGLVDDEKARTLIHGYHAAVSYIDAQIGKVIDELDRLKLSGNTIIVLWGDHGWHLGDHGWWSKHTNYEQATRIPLIVIAPGVTKPGSRATKTFIETVDIYPTVAELAGYAMATPPQHLDGQSFAGVLREPTAQIKDHAFNVFPRGQRIGRALRNDRYRLVEWKIPNAPAESAEFELYDYEADPLETKNWAKDRPETVSELRALLSKEPEAKPQIR